MSSNPFEPQAPDHVALKPYPKVIVSETADRSVRQILAATDYYPSLSVPISADNVHEQILIRWPHLGFDLIDCPPEVQNLENAKLYAWLNHQNDRWEATDNIEVEEVEIADPKYPKDKHDYLPLGVNQRYAAVFIIEPGEPTTYTLMVYTFAEARWRNTLIQYDNYSGAVLENGGFRLFVVVGGRVVCLRLGPKKPRQAWMSSRLINSKLLSVLHASFGKLYVGIHDQEEVLLMDAEGGALLQRVETPVMSIASCDGLFACGTDSGHIRLFVEEKEVVVKKPTMAAQEDGNTTVVLEEKTLKGPRFLPAMHAAYLREYESVSGVQINIKQNPDEIPEHLRRLVQAITPQPIPTVGPGQPSRITIKSIGVDAPIVQGDDWEQLKKGVGHHLATANPGERCNMVLSAHNDVFGEIFRYLEKVELKDEILVYSGSRVFRYVVTQKRVIEPTEVSVMYPTSDPTTTLITCYPYLVDNKRLVVIAELQP